MIRWIVVALMAVACAPAPEVAWQDRHDLLLRYGYLRLDRAPRDAPYTNADIARAFRHIMFVDEHVWEDGTYRPAWRARPLEKRTGPVTYTLAGGGVTETDRRHMREIAERLTDATGLEVRNADEGADIHLFIAGAKEREGFAAALAERRADHPLVGLLRNDLGGNTCVAFPFLPKDGTGDPPYLIFIPDEVTGRLRRGCIEEEFAQAFGPAADFPEARPSIFNDDFEFAVFTELDTWMFRVLYDPRLRPGMLEAQAMPIVHRILAEIRPE
ncbi:MAG: DUF2927 domain-containing protein [Pseudomonadota bacterium]